MDSGNSGSISSSGDEEYDSRVDHNHNTVLHHHHHPSPFLNQFASSISQSLPSSSHFHQSQLSLFDLNPNYLHALAQSQPPISPSYLNLDTATSSQGRRSDHCTDIAGVSSSSTPPPTVSNSMNQCLLAPPQAADNARAVLSSSQQGNVNARNSKKRTRASRRAPTTVLTTDTSNFRAMVQEFTGIPAPPFSSSSSYSRRLDILTGSSSLRSNNSTSHLDATITNPFYPLRPSPQKLHQNPLLLSSTSPSPSTLLHNNMVDAIASTTTTNNNNNNSSPNININFQQQQQQQLPHELGIPYHHNMMLSMQNHPSLAFHPSLQQQPLQPFGNNFPIGAKLPSIEDLGMSHGQVNNNNANFVVDDGGGRREVQLRSLDIGGGRACKLNFSGASASASLNHEKRTLEHNDNNNSTTAAATRGEGTVDSWICSSD